MKTNFREPSYFQERIQHLGAVKVERSLVTARATAVGENTQKVPKIEYKLFCYFILLKYQRNCQRGVSFITVSIKVKILSSRGYSIEHIAQSSQRDGPFCGRIKWKAIVILFQKKKIIIRCCFFLDRVWCRTAVEKWSLKRLNIAQEAICWKICRKNNTTKWIRVCCNWVELNQSEDREALHKHLMQYTLFM